MKKLVLLIGLALLLAGFQVATAKDAPKAAPERARCESCGMFMDHSPTQVMASIKLDKKTATHQFESLNCLYTKLKEWGAKASLQSAKVLDYNSFGTTSLKWLSVDKAWFLYDTSQLKGSMPTYTAAFASKDAAKAAQKTLGGTLLQWDAVKAKFAAE